MCTLRSGIAIFSKPTAHGHFLETFASELLNIACPVKSCLLLFNWGQTTSPKFPKVSLLFLLVAVILLKLARPYTFAYSLPFLHLLHLNTLETNPTKKNNQSHYAEHDTNHGSIASEPYYESRGFFCSSRRFLPLFVWNYMALDRVHFKNAELIAVLKFHSLAPKITDINPQSAAIARIHIGRKYLYPVATSRPSRLFYLLSF